MAAPPLYTIVDILEHLAHLLKYGTLQWMASEKKQ